MKITLRARDGEMTQQLVELCALAETSVQFSSYSLQLVSGD